MKRVRIQSGGSAGQGTEETGSPVRGGDVEVTIPEGVQLSKVFIVPGTDEETGVTGTWVQINEQTPMFIVIPVILCRDDFGYCCPPHASGADECGPFTGTYEDECDIYPGNVQIVINIGEPAQPNGTPGNDFAVGMPAVQWFVMYFGG